MPRRSSVRSIPAHGDETVRPPRKWGRTAAAAAASITTALAVTGAASAGALAASSSGPSWQFVKHVHSGSNGDFTAVVAVGKNGGWAFNGNGFAKPTAWKRSGGSWTQVSFPGHSNEEVVAAGASSATNVWAFTDAAGGGRALRWNGSSWSAKRSFGKQIGGAVVISATDVWVFGEPVSPGSALGSWHYNGHTWAKVTSGHGLEGGSALSASSIWAFAGTSVAHWNGSTWTRTSVAALLPAKQLLNDPAVVGIDAQSRNSVYAVGSGNLEDEGGPTVILHYNGHSWAKVAQGSFGIGTSPLQQVASDGHGGLWLPMPAAGPERSFLVHYSAGKLTAAALPTGPTKINVESIAHIPGTAQLLAGGFTHGSDNLGANVVAVLLQYQRG
jgi:hypothetical protein